MLNEIINKVAEKTGISSENATTAVTTVLDFLKKKLPAAMRGNPGAAAPPPLRAGE